MAREALAVIIRFAGQAPFRLRPLSSNVRQLQVAVRSIEVLQHEFTVFEGAKEDAVVFTNGVLICTAWYGYDPDSKVAFMCHFDHPWSTNSMPAVLAELRRVSPKNHHYISKLAGGKSWWWSNCTRRFITQHVRQADWLSIDIEPASFKNWPPYEHFAIATAGGQETSTPLPATRKLEGWSWIVKPMRRVE